MLELLMQYTYHRYNDLHEYTYHKSIIFLIVTEQNKVIQQNLYMK